MRLGVMRIVGRLVAGTALTGIEHLGLDVSRENFALRTDSDLAQIALLRAGAGIGGLQRQLAVRDRSLVPVLHNTIRLPLEMWLVMHEDLRTTRRVRVVYDLLADGLTAYVKGRTRRGVD